MYMCASSVVHGSVSIDVPANHPLLHRSAPRVPLDIPHVDIQSIFGLYIRAEIIRIECVGGAR